MAIEKDSCFPGFSRRRNSLNAYRIVEKATRKIRCGDMSTPTYNFIMAGVVFLSNRGRGRYMRNIGTIAWEAMSRGLPVAVANDMAETTINLGLHPGDAYLKYGQNDGLRLIVETRKDGLITRDNACILATPEFIMRTKKDPIGALAITAGICSQISDFLNLRHLIDPVNTMTRSNATEAHLLLSVAGRERSRWRLSPNHQRLLKLFPEGIQSLPEEIRYTAGQYMDTPRIDVGQIYPYEIAGH